MMLMAAAAAKRNQSSAAGRLLFGGGVSRSSISSSCCCPRGRRSCSSSSRRKAAPTVSPTSFIDREANSNIKIQKIGRCSTCTTAAATTSTGFKRKTLPHFSSSSFSSYSASTPPSNSGTPSSHRQHQRQRDRATRRNKPGGGKRLRDDVETRARKLIQFSKELILELDDLEDNMKMKKNMYQRGNVIDRLLNDWNTALKQVHENTQQHKNSNNNRLLLLEESVEVIDALVRKILASKLSSSNEQFAIYVGVSAWARVASPDNAAAGIRAEELFQLYDDHFNNDNGTTTMNIGLQKTYMRHRRDSYHALLLTWSRIASTRNRMGAERALYWSDRMKKEELVLRDEKGFVFHQLISIHCYNRVLAALASCGEVEQVERLIEEEEMLLKMKNDGGSGDLGRNSSSSSKRSNIRFDAVTYDCLIKAHQVQGHSPDRAHQVFHQQLAKYRELHRQEDASSSSSSVNVNSSLKPLPLTLGRVLSMCRTDPDQGKEILERALEFEEEYPECRGLVGLRSFISVIQSYTKQDRVEEAEALLVRLFQLAEAGNYKLKPNRVVLGIIMDGYAQRQTLESVSKVEAMINSIEDRVLEVDSAKADVDCTAYNILMTSYLRTYEPSEAIRMIQNTIMRMELLSKRHSKPDLRADSVSYTILMKALVKEGLPGFEYKVEDVLNLMMATSSADGLVEAKGGTAKPRLHCFAVALDAWAKSEDCDPDEAVRKAERILALIDFPDTTCYNIVANIYAKTGRPHQAIEVLNRMKSDYEGGRNRLCHPDNITYSTVIHALCNSRASGSWKDALATFDDMLSRYEIGDTSCKPTQKTVTALLHLLKLSSVEEVSDKLCATRDILKRLERFNLQLGPITATAFIGACSETHGEQEHKRQALAYIIEVLQRFDKSQAADSAMYNAALEACHRLLLDDDGLDDDEHCDALAEIFQKCADAGQVNRLVLNTLWKICPADVYLRLTAQDARKTPNLDTIPTDWKRNIIITT